MGVLICELGEEILTQIIRLLLAFQVKTHMYHETHVVM